MKYLHSGAVAFVLAAACFQAAAQTAPATDTPNGLIQSVASQMLKELDAHRAEYRKDPKKVYNLVDQVLLPHFDTEYAARLVLGQHWRSATADQRKRFIDAFYHSLLQNYGTALLDFTADRMKVLPYRGEANANSAVVRTQVKRDDGTQVDVNYTLHKAADGWKAWDVTIEGISYVRNYRMDFGSAIDRDGLEKVIQRLETQGYKPQSRDKG